MKLGTCKYSPCEWVLLKRFSGSGQRSRTWQDQTHFCGAGMDFDGVVLALVLTAVFSIPFS